MITPYENETPLTEEERYIIEQEIDYEEEINEISPFDTVYIDKEKEYFERLIESEPKGGLI